MGRSLTGRLRAHEVGKPWLATWQFLNPKAAVACRSLDGFRDVCLYHICDVAELHLVLECAALQGLRDDMPTMSENVQCMRCFMAGEHDAHIQGCSGCYEDDKGS